MAWNGSWRKKGVREQPVQDVVCHWEMVEMIIESTKPIHRTLRLEAGLDDYLKWRARREHRSVSGLLRLWIQEKRDEEKGRPAKAGHGNNS